MATTVTGKLNKAATQFQAGESTGFGIRLGVKFFDRETKSDQWTNFEAVIFAKAPAQVQFYQQVLVEGAVVEVSGDKCKIRQFQGNNGLSLSIEILDAKLGFVHAPQQAQQQQPAQRQQQPAQQQYNPMNNSQVPQQQRQAPPANYQPQYGQPMQQAPDFDSSF
jgi:single-strand DNA-binding protein